MTPQDFINEDNTTTIIIKISKNHTQTHISGTGDPAEILIRAAQEIDQQLCDLDHCPYHESPSEKEFQKKKIYDDLMKDFPPK